MLSIRYWVTLPGNFGISSILVRSFNASGLPVCAVAVWVNEAIVNAAMRRTPFISFVLKPNAG